MLDYVVQVTRDATRIGPQHHEGLRRVGYPARHGLLDAADQQLRGAGATVTRLCPPEPTAEHVPALGGCVSLPSQPARASSYRYSTCERTAPSMPRTAGFVDSMM